jgi:hypothetical protein
MTAPQPTNITNELPDRIHDLCLRWLNRARTQKLGSVSYRQGVEDALTDAAAELAGEIGGTP